MFNFNFAGVVENVDENKQTLWFCEGSKCGADLHQCYCCTATTYCYTDRDSCQVNCRGSKN